MKGVITTYFEEKGYGFIVDENEENRFFHINSIKNQKKFLKNISAYINSDFYQNRSFILSFTPSQNHEGLTAINIELTSDVLNDQTWRDEFEATVTNLKYETLSFTRTTSGIGKGTPKPFGATAGSNGTYRIGYPEEIRELKIYFKRKDDIGWGSTEVRGSVLIINKRKKITTKLINKLRTKLVGNTIKVSSDGTNWILCDHSILKE